jgi:bacteriocin-like protein
MSNRDTIKNAKKHNDEAQISTTELSESELEKVTGGSSGSYGYSRYGYGNGHRF